MNMDINDLDERKKLVLKTIVESYIQDASPISSRVVGEKCAMDVSSATIRNEMHALEQSGHLFSLHTSSGKIPTDKGYRFYVDNFVANKATRQEPDVLKTTRDLHNSNLRLGNALKNTVHEISKLTSQTVLCVTDENPTAKIFDVHTTLLADGKVVITLVLDDSSVEKVVIETAQLSQNQDLSRDQIDVWQKLLLASIQSKSLYDVSNTNVPMGYSDSDTKFLDLVLKELRKQTTHLADTSVHLTGVAKLAENASKELEDHTEITTKLLLLLEQHMEIAQLIKTSVSTNTDATIGTENTRQELTHHSMVLTPFSTPFGETGALGVIGPKRMNYKKVFALLENARNNLNKVNE